MKGQESVHNQMSGPFLGIIVSKSKGKEGPTFVLSEPRLEVTGFADEFITDLLNREGVDWAREFEVICSEGILDRTDKERTKELIRTVQRPKGSKGLESTLGRQHLRFSTADERVNDIAEILKEQEASEEVVKEGREKWESCKEAEDGTDESRKMTEEAWEAYLKLMDVRLDLAILLWMHYTS